MTVAGDDEPTNTERIARWLCARYGGCGWSKLDANGRAAWLEDASELLQKWHAMPRYRRNRKRRQKRKVAKARCARAGTVIPMMNMPPNRSITSRVLRATRGLT